MEGHNFERLKSHIVPLSNSMAVETARQIGLSRRRDRCKGLINVPAVGIFWNIATFATGSMAPQPMSAMSASTASSELIQKPL